MDLRQLEFFAAAAQAGNFTRAAREYGVTESGLQKQIRGLERELDLDLFERVGRTVQLTAAGRQLADKVEGLLTHAQEVTDLAIDLRAGSKGLVTIGCHPAQVVRFLAPVSKGFAERHPGIRIKLGEHPGDQVIEGQQNLYEKLFDGRLDFMIGPLRPSGITVAEVYKTKGVAIFPDDHPLRHKRSVNVTVLRNQSIICLPRGLWFRSILEDACMKAGFRPHMDIETTVEALVALARHGYGVGVLSDDNLPITTEPYPELRDANNEPIEATHWLQWRADRPLGRSGDSFVSYVREFVANQALPIPTSLDATTSSSQ